MQHAEDRISMTRQSSTSSSQFCKFFHIKYIVSICYKRFGFRKMSTKTNTSMQEVYLVSSLPDNFFLLKTMKISEQCVKSAHG